MKKMARIIVAAVLVVAMMTANVFAAGGPQIVVNDATAKDGKAEVVIDIKNNTGFAGYTLVVEYGDELTLADYENGKFTGGMIDVNTEENMVSFMAVSNQTGDGTLVKLIFDVADGEYLKDKKVDVKVNVDEFFDENIDDINITVDNGVVTIPSNHKHEAAGDWQKDADNHWKECACGEELDKDAHTASDWIVDREATTTEKGSKHKECTVCGYEMVTEEIPMIHEHKGEGDWQKDDKDHWKICECGDIVEKAAHTPSDWIVEKEATPDEDGLKYKECTVCGAVIEEEVIEWECKVCDPVGDWQHDADYHWYVCGVCGDPVDKAEHDITWTVEKEATETEEGLKTGVCTVCEREFEEVIPMITPEKPEPPAGDDADKDADKDANKDKDEETSDNFNVLLFGMVAMAALAAACGTLFVRRRNEK